MKYRALATDYDGTIASDGRVAPSTVEALTRARAAAVQLVLVTGRELADLLDTFDNADLFARIVAENGAILHDPGTHTLQALASAPPPALLELLVREGIPVSTGHSIVATAVPHEYVLLDA